MIPVSQCLSQCGFKSRCTGLLAPTTAYECSCQDGFFSITNDGRNCSDNYCLVNNGGCQQICNNTGPGISTCSCNVGYTSFNTTCTAINNCVVANGGCQQICKDTGPGANSCSCNTGYTLFNKTCTPINNCVIDNGGCQHICFQSGSNNTAACLCNYGFTLNPDGKNCSNSTASSASSSSMGSFTITYNSFRSCLTITFQPLQMSALSRE